MQRKTFFLFVLFSLLFSEFSMAQKASAKNPALDLSLTSDDVFIERNSGRSIGTSTDGFNLYIRKKSGVQSVLLVETTKDPLGKETNYAYRAEKYNSLNGDEVRLLNGKKLDSDSSRYSLISSTVVHTDRLGDCFLVYIPRKMVYGYPWSRNGTVEIAKELSSTSVLLKKNMQTTQENGRTIHSCLILYIKMKQMWITQMILLKMKRM